MLLDRWQSLQARYADHQLDVVAIMPGPNMHYFAELEFHLSERPILALFPPDASPALIAPTFEVAKVTAADHPFNWQFFPWRDEDGPEGAFAAAADALALDGQTLGVETLGMRVKEYSLLQSVAPALNIVPADPLITALRLIKDEVEVAAMRAAARLAEKVLQETLPTIRVGMTERELAAELLVGLHRAGSEPLPFEPLVQTGVTGAAPHANPGDRPLAPGDLLIIDFGARVGGYVSDITRTFAVQHLSDDSRHRYAVVRAANEAGVQTVRPGVPCEAIDQAARAVIDVADLGQYFIHRTGHGIGLEGHEPPYLVAGSALPLAAGMTFTVEPGVYVPGVGGIRIEDDVLVTEDGVERLTEFSRDLQFVG